MEASLEKLTEKITAFETEVDEAKGPKRANCCNQIDPRKGIGEQIKAELEEIQKAESHECKNLQERAEKIKKQLEDSIDFPISRFP